MTPVSSEAPTSHSARSPRWLAVPLLLGALVALTAGVTARSQLIEPGDSPRRLHSALLQRPASSQGLVRVGGSRARSHAAGHGRLDLREAAMAASGLDPGPAPLGRQADPSLHHPGRLSLHLQARLSDHRHPRPGALALRVRGLRGVRRQDHDRAAAPLPRVGVAECRRPPLRRARRCLVLERALVLPDNRGRNLGQAAISVARFGLERSGR